MSKSGKKEFAGCISMLSGARLLIVSLICFSLCAVAWPAFSQTISIQGNKFYEDGKPWLAKGVHVGAFARPQSIPSAPKWMNDTAVEARGKWTPSALDAARTVFHANTIRFDFSQPVLDPQSPIHDPAYLSEVLALVKSVRAQGFVVIAALNAQAPSGASDLPCMPGDSAVRAWKALAPGLANDGGVMLELFNEPCKWGKPEVQKEWAQGMQPIIDAVRAAGAKNILLLDGLWYARQTNGLFPLVHDSMPNRMALAVHPYLVKGSFVNEQQWRDMFGASAAQYPLIVTEWNAIDGCVADNLPDLALTEIRYLQSLHVGVVAWAMDSNYGRLVKDREKYEPIDYQNFHGCVPSSKDHPAPPGDWGIGKLFAAFPNN